MWLIKLYNDKKITKEKLLEIRLQAFRQIREAQFKAFDIWEKAVIRGREQDSVDVMNWYELMKTYPDRITEKTLSSDYPQLPNELKKYM